MESSTAPIRALITEANASLSRLEAKAAVLRTQIESWEMAIKAVESASQGQGGENQEQRGNRTRRLIALSGIATGKRRRGPSVAWAKLLEFIGTFPDGAKSDKIREYSEAQALGIDRNSLRSQLHNYSVSGVLERVSPGVFRLTDQGRKSINETLENDMLEKTVA
jgi:hypothetical protein